MAIKDLKDSIQKLDTHLYKQIDDIEDEYNDASELILEIVKVLRKYMTEEEALKLLEPLYRVSLRAVELKHSHICPELSKNIPKLKDCFKFEMIGKYK